MTGIVFNIQKMSIHDGPGIRSTIFLKGCPLKCVWCANPESQSVKPEIAFSANRCIECGYCAQICPVQIIEQDPPYRITDRNECIGCMQCAEECCVNAKKTTGEEYSEESLLREILKDKAFYESSGGGVTFSGGEPFVQSDFLLSMLKRCKENGIHTAIETCGFTDISSLLEAAEYTDLIYYDIKHMDPVEHLKLTGVTNELILKNLEALSMVHENIIARTPVIPSMNSGVKNISETAKFVSSLGISEYELLPYHNLGEIKHKQLDKEYGLSDLSSPETAQMEELVISAKNAIVAGNTKVGRQNAFGEM